MISLYSAATISLREPLYSEMRICHKAVFIVTAMKTEYFLDMKVFTVAARSCPWDLNQNSLKSVHFVSYYRINLFSSSILEHKHQSLKGFYRNNFEGKDFFLICCWH